MINYILLGLMMGFFTATSGYIKDKMFEPFELRKYFRSIYITGVGAIVCYLFYPSIEPLLVMSFSFLFERLVFELWKAFLRPVTKPGKFSKPQRDTRWIIDRLKELKDSLKE